MDDEGEFELLHCQRQRFDRCVVVACLIALLAIAGLIEFSRWCLTSWL